MPAEHAAVVGGFIRDVCAHTYLLTVAFVHSLSTSALYKHCLLLVSLTTQRRMTLFCHRHQRTLLLSCFAMLFPYKTMLRSRLTWTHCKSSGNQRRTR